MNLIKSLILVGAVASFGTCGDVPKTLPDAFYETAKSGKKLDKVQIDAAFDKSKGFEFDGKLEYVADRRDSTLIDSLNDQLKAVSTVDCGVKLHLAVVEVTTKTFAFFGWVPGKLIVEGRLTNPAGSVVGTFRHKVSVVNSMGGNGPVDGRETVDKLISAMLKDLK